MHRAISAVLTVALGLAASAAQSVVAAELLDLGDVGAPASTSAPATTIDRRLSTMPVAGERFTRRYADAFRAALPPIPRAEVEALLESIRKEHADGFDPLNLRSGVDVAKLFAVTPSAKAKGGLVVEDSFAYGIEPETSWIVFSKKRPSRKPMTVSVAKGLRDDVGRKHLGLLARIGVDAAQLHLPRTVLVSMRSEKLGGGESAGATYVDSFLTYTLRSLDGIQVDGSYAKVIATGRDDVVDLDMVWPAVKLHPGLGPVKCKSAAALESKALPLVREVAGGQEVELMTAIVLRPIRLKGERFYLPALKIGVVPRDGEGEIGEVSVFHVDLLEQSLPSDPEDLRDDGPES